jgi:cellulose synthase/poly-beta-1,6-N-acetylglucosamine synthase-like glycosyltransferase
MPVFDYAIIIPAYNEAEELPATLAAVQTAMAQQKQLRGECVVVDNNSNDATTEVALAAGAHRVVFEPINQIARARNAGANSTAAPWLIFIDADTRIHPNLLTSTLQYLSTQSAGGGSLLHFERPVSCIGQCSIHIWNTLSRLTKTAAGGYLYCRKAAFDAIGGFDEKLYASEEVRFSRLLRKWARKNGCTINILTEFPAQTSSRKLAWYSGVQILCWVAFMMLIPFAVYSRSLCSFWYKRPEKRVPKS